VPLSDRLRRLRTIPFGRGVAPDTDEQQRAQNGAQQKRRADQDQLRSQRGTR
jgi:hypothetical protein